jgi:uncharacterized membrane protein affecting hemolysin expression
MVTATLATFVRQEIADANTTLVGMLRVADATRQSTEDVRSERRNRNRMWTLLVGLLISIVLTYTLSHDVFGTWATKTLGPYSFAITIALDSMLTVYAYIRRY